MNKIKDSYGANLKKNRGKIHDYLRMVFDYSAPGEVRIGMDSYIVG